MNKKDLRIVFMGTPAFAVAGLNSLIENGYNVVGVVTMPDKPAGRGHQVQFSDVKKYALSHNLNLLQPEKLKSPVFLEQLSALSADLQIVVAFRMLPEVVWNMPPLGTFNLHASLLPNYRGAAPINWALINGETETGVTTFFLTHEIDTGNIIFQDKIAIEPDDNAGSLHDKLMFAGANLIIKTVNAILTNNIHLVSQDDLLKEGKTFKFAPKLFKPDCKINWQQTSVQIYNFVRGLSPYPAAWTEIQTSANKIVPVKVYDVEPIQDIHQLIQGTIQTDEKTFVNIAVPDGFVSLKTLQLPSKKKMNIADLLRGYKITNEFKSVNCKLDDG